MAPGREDLSPWPPVGQFNFKKIETMTEPELDRAFQERHNLDGIFKRDKQRDAYDGISAKISARRLNLKRVVMARLEGINLGDKSGLWDWYGGPREEIENPVASLRRTLTNFLTPECLKRMHEVVTHVAREAAVHRPRAELRKLEERISARLKKLGLDPLSAGEIFNEERLPSHSKATRERTTFDTEFGLRVFLAQLDGITDAECAQLLRVSRHTIRLKALYFSGTAKKVLRIAHEKSKLPYKREVVE